MVSKIYFSYRNSKNQQIWKLWGCVRLCRLYSDYLLLEEVLPVAERAKFGLLLLVLQFLLRRAKVKDEILKREDDSLQRKRHMPWWLVLPIQRVQTPGRTQTTNVFLSLFIICMFQIKIWSHYNAVNTINKWEHFQDVRESLAHASITVSENIRQK